MSTLATTRPPLSLVTPVADVFRRAMHPDNVLLPKHSASSPRLTAASLHSTAGDAQCCSEAMSGSEQLCDEQEEGGCPAAAEDVKSDDDDAVSLCSSEDSDLSVGQEDPLDVRRAGVVPTLCRPSAFSSVSAAEAAPQDNAALDPFAVAANALRMPVPLLARSSASRLQEELLRKSQLYAEQLMKQQMQLMAAGAFTLRQPTSPVFAAHQQPPQPPATAKLCELPNFAGIQSHLSAITKMTQLGAAAAAAAAAAVGGDALAKLTAFGLSNAPTQTTAAAAAAAANLGQLQARLPSLNENLEEPALKFSIDNILKADFGRRITEPLKRGGGANGARATRASQLQQQRGRKSGGAPATTPMDLTSQMTAAAAAVTTATTGSASLAFCSNSNDSSSTAVSSNFGTSELLKSPASLTGASVCSGSPTPAAGGERDAAAADGATSSSSSASSNGVAGAGASSSGSGPIVWPAWVYCTRYSDRPSSGRSPRARKPKKPASEKGAASTTAAAAAAATLAEDKRPRTAFSGSQLARLKHEFTENRYLTEKRRQQLSSELGLNEAQIKIWFQNKRAKLKKSSGTKNPLALQLMAQGLYNHSTVPLTREEEELQQLQERERENAASP